MPSSKETGEMSRYCAARFPRVPALRHPSPPPLDPTDDYDDVPALISAHEDVQSSDDGSRPSSVPSAGAAIERPTRNHHACTRPDHVLLRLDSPVVARYIQSYFNTPQLPFIILPPSLPLIPSLGTGALTLPRAPSVTENMTTALLPSDLSHRSPPPEIIMNRGTLAYHGFGEWLWAPSGIEATPCTECGENHSNTVAVPSNFIEPPYVEDLVLASTPARSRRPPTSFH
ncbi:hypothetical protein DFP72DRAFT_1073992 [Ephemerocybe angulata]|uniref:Uncharacterized protein n=1 Tax=Ephemerocybe angulata TaxID=980116 RepID=A0A8H6M1X0_9AGAR|nr:hypothetical protein DFP72DRAFT_1073992 [Tulosesus angulatus]